MKEIEFLNIDLDIESKDDISLIIKEFGERVTVHKHQNHNSLFCASLSTGYMSENEIIEEYLALVTSLSQKARKVWDACLKREFDFGYESGEYPNNFHSKISSKSLEAIVKMGGSMVVTIYPLSVENT